MPPGLLTTILLLHRDVPARRRYLGAGLDPGRACRAGRSRIRLRSNIVCGPASGRANLLGLYLPRNSEVTGPPLIDLKRVINWARTGGCAFGVDPDRIFVSGGSAGAHIAAMAILTPGRDELQPGFEGADTSVSGGIGLYAY